MLFGKFSIFNLIYVLGLTKSLNILLSLILKLIFDKLLIIGVTGATFDLTNFNLYIFDD